MNKAIKFFISHDFSEKQQQKEKYKKKNKQLWDLRNSGINPVKQSNYFIAL